MSTYTAFPITSIYAGGVSRSVPVQSQTVVSQVSPRAILEKPPTPDRPITDKVHISAGSSRGTIPARSATIQQAFARPNSPVQQAQQDFGRQVVQGGKAEARFPEYGKDFVSIVLEGRTPEDYKLSLQDPFITNMAEMALWERYKPLVEEQIKSWLPFLKRSSLNTANGQGLDMAIALDFKQHDLVQPLDQQSALRFFKPTIGVKLNELSTAGAFVKPGVDLVTYRNEDKLELTLYAGAPVNLKGKVYPEAALNFSQGLVNPSTQSEKATFLDARTSYDGTQSQGAFQLGLRQQFNQDTDLSVYGRASHTFGSVPQSDLGVGVYFGHRFE